MPYRLTLDNSFPGQLQITRWVQPVELSTAKRRGLDARQTVLPKPHLFRVRVSLFGAWTCTVTWLDDADAVAKSATSPHVLASARFELELTV